MYVNQAAVCVFLSFVIRPNICMFIAVKLSQIALFTYIYSLCVILFPHTIRTKFIIKFNVIYLNWISRERFDKQCFLICIQVQKQITKTVSQHANMQRTADRAKNGEIRD